jgi:amino acid transporter
MSMPTPLLGGNQHGIASQISSQGLHLPRERKLTLLGLMAVAFFTTCGGPFGLEPLPSTVGPGWAVVFILVSPLVWSLPIALMVAELATLMPEEGGYYIWVREALGSFWAVQEAWWTMASAVGLLASFPVLFAGYLSFFIPALVPAANSPHAALLALIRWLIAVLFIASAAVVNLRGVRDVGRSSKFGAAFVLGAFALMVVGSMFRNPAPGAIVSVLRQDLLTGSPGTLLLGLSIVSFNFSGWDNVSTFAAEVDRPQRNYPIAIAGAMVTMVLCYLFPVLAGLNVTTDPAQWSTDAGWPVISRLIGGPWLGALLAAAGIVAMWGLFNAQLLYVSRLPFVMATDGWLPRTIAHTSPETGVPKRAVLLFCAITAIFAALSFGDLAVIICALYTPALVLEFISLLIMRVRRPDSPRGFRIPGGWWGLSYVCLTFSFAALVLLVVTLREWRSYPGQLLVVGITIVCGVLLYFARRKVAVLDCRLAWGSPSPLDPAVDQTPADG